MRAREPNAVFRAVACCCLTFSLLTQAAMAAGQESAAHRGKGFQLAYNLDYHDAVAAFRRAIAADPNDPAPYRALAAVTWLRIAVFNRGSLSVTDYLGRQRRPARSVGPPPAEQAAQFRDNITRAVTLSERLVAARPTDADAHYQLGASIGVLASYEAVIEGRLRSALMAARRAYKEHEHVLRLNPNRKDANLVVGTYRYFVSSLSFPARWMAYLAGFGGGRERGLQMVEEAATFPSEAQIEARLVLVLLYHRERRFDAALRLLQDLQRQFPRNRFLWLNEGVIAERADRHARAEQVLSHGVDLMRADTRERAFGEEAMWHYQRGAARVALRNIEGARTDLQHALTRPARPWVHGRTNIELGKLRDLAGDRRGAQALYQKGEALCRSDADSGGAMLAQRLKRVAYK